MISEQLALVVVVVVVVVVVQPGLAGGLRDSWPSRTPVIV